MSLEFAGRDKQPSPKELAELSFRGMNENQGQYPHHQYNILEPSWAFESAWPLSQQIQAVLMTDKAYAPNINVDHELSQRLDALHYYWDDHAYASGANTWWTKHERLYDDNAWIGLDLMDVYQRDPHGQGWALDQTKQIFNFEKRGADEAMKVAHEPGGVMWGEGGMDNQYRAAVSTSAATQLAMRLYDATHDHEYLDFATKQFKWMEDHLDNGQGLYGDGVHGDGAHNPDIVSYSQGLMMTNAAMLYKATGDHNYLDKAQRTMNAACNFFNECELERMDPIYNAVFFRNLAQTDDILNSPDETRAQHFRMLQAYADYLSNHMDDNNMVTTGRESGRTQKYLTQAAAVQIFSLRAQLQK